MSDGLKKSASAHEFYEELNGHINAVNQTIQNSSLRQHQQQQQQQQQMHAKSNPGSTNHSASASPTATLNHNNHHHHLHNSSGDSISAANGGSASTTSSSSSAVTTSTSLPELQSHVNQLEDKIMREQRRRRSLEHAVRRLTEENRRLQDESQTAVQQLRTFTEWFFQTIDRQS